MSYNEEAVGARVSRPTVRDLRLWVREGWVRPAVGGSGPVFDDLDIARIRLLCDLCKDMSIPRETMPAILSLIDRLHQTRRELHRLARAVHEQPEEVRQSVMERLGTLGGSDPGNDQGR